MCFDTLVDANLTALQAGDNNYLNLDNYQNYVRSLAVFAHNFLSREKREISSLDDLFEFSDEILDDLMRNIGENVTSLPEAFTTLESVEGMTTTNVPNLVVSTEFYDYGGGLNETEENGSAGGSGSGNYTDYPDHSEFPDFINFTTLAPFEVFNTTMGEYNTTIIELSTILMQNLTTMFPNENFTTIFTPTTEPITTPFVFTGNISDYSEFHTCDCSSINFAGEFCEMYTVVLQKRHENG